ncbi:oxidoreductase [Lactiplantibacillus sp. WILCCON 0030]|uniref:Oxidoreductase n=1 Tax=Lactiplantibacillus brownii TaxID=3069269 RepID=A0ABU1A7N8_9LACO|nr:oxidoreductase [Lactiplantibacillus brownii]MDQ7936883.1 oxidoreductase [Lactiplantibacillus brownii]
MTNQVALITGASSGMGKAAAIRFHQAGYTVYAGARRLDRMADLAAQGIHTLKLDVTLPASNQAFVQAALDHEGRIDVLINDAGYGSMGAIEDVAPAEARRQFDVNVFGAANLIQLVLPTMRRQHAGKIVNNSSIGGQLYSSLGGWYYASKHALEALSDSLRLEVKDFSIDVMIIEPGGTATNWQQTAVDHMLAATPKDSAYRKMVETYALGTWHFKATGDDIAQLMLKAVTARHPKTRYQLTLMDTLAVVAARKLSYKMFDRGMRLATRLGAHSNHNQERSAESQQN